MLAGSSRPTDNSGPHHVLRSRRPWRVLLAEETIDVKRKFSSIQLRSVVILLTDSPIRVPLSPPALLAPTMPDTVGRAASDGAQCLPHSLPRGHASGEQQHWFMQRRMRSSQMENGTDQLLDLVTVGGLDQRIAAWKRVVKRSGSDGRGSRDLVEGGGRGLIGGRSPRLPDRNRLAFLDDHPVLPPLADQEPFIKTRTIQLDDPVRVRRPHRGGGDELPKQTAGRLEKIDLPETTRRDRLSGAVSMRLQLTGGSVGRVLGSRVERDRRAGRLLMDNVDQKFKKTKIFRRDP